MMMRFSLLSLAILLFGILGLHETSGVLWDLPRETWLRLDHLSDYTCGLTQGGEIAENQYTGSPWFCVHASNCRAKDGLTQSIWDESLPDYKCNQPFYNNGQDKCCYITDVLPKFKAFKGESIQDSDTRIYLYTKTLPEKELVSLDEYKWALFHEQKSYNQREELKKHHICHLEPSGIQDGQTIYTPYVCMEPSKCNRSELHQNVNHKVRSFLGDRYCSLLEQSSSSQPYCCHISQLIDINKKQSSFSYKEFHPLQRYAPTFRSTFMCDQYQRLVCDGKQDMCPLRILDRHNSVPGEFPHQALVGVSLQAIQLFHCAASLVSKHFLLSAYDCRIRKNVLANLALLGDYKLNEVNEKYSKEQVTYIKRHYSRNLVHSFILFRLWRPVEFSFQLRPACLDWSFYLFEKDGELYDFGKGWLTGFGPSSRTDSFNNTVKRYFYRFKDEHWAKEMFPLQKCYNNIPKYVLKRLDPSINKTQQGLFFLQGSKRHICVSNGYTFSFYPNFTKNIKPEVKPFLHSFDHGAPFSVLKRYCQWHIYGVSINYPVNPDSNLIELVPSALEWIESVVWRKDFNLLSFNLSWPECANAEGYTFSDMKYLDIAYKYHYILPKV